MTTPQSEPQDVPAELLRPLEDRIAETAATKAAMLAEMGQSEPSQAKKARKKQS